MTTADIRSMSVNERLRTMEQIWDSFQHEEVELESPEWHAGILAERQQKVAEGTAKFVSLDELRARRA